MIDHHIRISANCFRDMILFSGKYANRLMDPEDLKHAYGYILGKQSAESIIDVVQFLPGEGGFSEEKQISKSGAKGNFDSKGLIPCGFFHAFPRSGGTISERDVASLSSFGLNSLCIVFDFTKVDQFNNGFLVFQMEGDYVINTPYTITHPENEDKFYFARSLVDLSEEYEFSGKLFSKSTSTDFNFDTQPSHIITNEERGSKEIENQLLVEIPLLEFEDYELSLIDQDFEVQKLRNDIDRVSKEGESSAYIKLQLANRLLSQMGKDSDILRYLESAEEEFNASSDKESRIGLAITKNELGLFYEERGNFYTALNYFDDAYAILEEIEDFSRKPRILNNIGNIYYQLNDFDNALKKYHEAYEKSTNLAEKVMVFNNIADVYLKLRNYGRTFSILAKNAEFFQESQNDYGLSVVFSKLGTLYYEQGVEYYKLAKKYTHLALAIKKRNEFHRESVDDYKLLSKIYLEEKANRVAEDSLAQGLNLVRTLGFEQLEAFFYENFGNLFLSENRVDESIEYFELARESYEKFAEKEREGQILETIGTIYLQNLRNMSKSLEYFENSLQIYKEENFRRKQADILVKIAELHIDLNENISALEFLHKARTLYETMYDEETAKIISERIKSIEY